MDERTDLRTMLRDQHTLDGCAAACCDHLVALGHTLLSVYLERSGRLRCYASRGYWQVLDGFPPEFGVIAATVRTGRPHLVDTRSSELYLQAAPDVVAEACVPVTQGGRTIGAINIESTKTFDVGVLNVAGEVATLLAARIDELGGLPEPRHWRLLADEAARLAQVTSPAEIAAVAIHAATRLSGAASAALVNRSAAGGLARVTAIGPMADELRRLSASSIAEIGRWVDGPQSCFTVGLPDGHGFTGQDSLRTAGVGTMVVVALRAHSEAIGFMLVADLRFVAPEPEVIEQLEVLGILAAGALQHAAHVDQLIDLGRRDPLTGLGHARAFSDRLDELALGRTRHAVLSIDVDHFKDVNDVHGHDAGDCALQTVAEAMNRALRLDDCLFRTGGDEFAVVVPVRDEADALRIAERIQRAAHKIGQPVSIGIAVSEPGVDNRSSLFARADRALYGVKRRGRNGTALGHMEHVPTIVSRPEAMTRR